MQRKHVLIVKRAQTPSFRDSRVPIIYFGGEPVPPAKPQVMQKLRERGIYSLPDGREFVAHAVFRGGYVFYTPEDWDLFGSHAFESDADGRVRWNGQRESWRTEDLIDTSRTANSRSRINARENSKS
jgi:hypothetical protein